VFLCLAVCAGGGPKGKLDKNTFTAEAIKNDLDRRIPELLHCGVTRSGKRGDWCT